MRYFILCISFVVGLIILGGCAGHDDQIEVVGTVSYEDVNSNSFNMKSEIDLYFQNLSLLTDSVKELSGIEKATRGVDMNGAWVLGADVCGAVAGAKVGWKMGKNLFAKISLSIACGAVMAIVSSVAASYGMDLFPKGIPFYDGNATVEIAYDYDYFKDGAFSAMLQSYSYRMGIDNELDFDYSVFEGIDYSIIFPFGSSTVFSDNDTTQYVDSKLIATIHNDALRLMLNEYVPVIDLEYSAEILGVSYVNSSHFDACMRNLDALFKDYGVQWIFDPSYSIVGPIPGDDVWEEQEKIANGTMELYLDALREVSLVDEELGASQIQILTDGYVSRINGADFIDMEHKHFLLSAVMVGMYSFHYWAYDSGAVFE